MFSWFTDMMCLGFKWFHELEAYMYEGMCLDENAKNSGYQHGMYHFNDKSSFKSNFIKSLLIVLPTFIIATLGLLYGLWKCSRFSEKSLWGSIQTAECVAKDVNLTGKVAVITGASDGLGKETTKVLLKQGACVVMGVRNREKGDETRREIIDYLTSKNYQPLHTLEKRIIMLSLDLSSLQSVRDFAVNFNKLGLPLHYLINNAGIMAVDHYELSKDGIEEQFQVNYLGHYYLTRLLTPKLTSTPNSRVINLTSSAFNAAPRPFYEWINKHASLPQGPLKEEYSQQGFTEYGISKACMLLFAREYQRRNDDTTSISVHPGNVDTKLWNENKWFKRFRYTFLKFLKYAPGEFKSIEQGAATIVYGVVATNDQIKPAGFYKDCTYADDDIRSDLRLPLLFEKEKEKENIKGMDKNIDLNMDTKLWDLSERLITKSGFDFQLPAL